MIRLFLLCLCVPFFASEFENLSLETCIQKARVYYPLHKNTALLEQALNLSLDKINLTFVPRLKFTGKFTHQNEVTDARFLGVSSPLYEPIDKTQY
ncbi:hypothetical protein FMM55_01605 [Campylobacter sp. LR196d]|nr:hypothetical protein [Campylobacter sp. LR196d]KAA6228298.1 hypothetical protein FMM55_01605 [Campylobacter sp. LR196d]